MGGRGVVAVDAVLDQQLPVGANAVFLRAADDVHAGLGLVGHQIKVFTRIAQVGGQVDDILVEGDKVKATVFLQPGGPHQVGLPGWLLSAPSLPNTQPW